MRAKPKGILLHTHGGKDIPRVQYQAERWLLKAANPGNSNAMKNLKHMYEHGAVDFPANPQEAKK